MWWSSGCGRIELEMTLAQARSASHPGDCSEEAKELKKHPKIARQLKKIDPEILRKELREYGAWDDEELADHDMNLLRLVWIAAGNIADEHPERR